MVPGSALTKKMNPRLQLGAICLMGPVCFFISSFMPGFWLWVLMITLCFSVFMQLCYMVPVHNCWLWFPDSPGTATGVIFAAIGTGGFFFNNLALVLVNPDGISAVNGVYPPEVNANVPYMIRTLSYIYFSLVLLSVVLIFPGPVPKTEEKVEESVQNRLTFEANENGLPEPTLRECLRDRQLWLIWGMNCLSFCKRAPLIGV